MIYVRKRDCCFLVRLTEEEMANLMKQVEKTGLSRENYIRALIEKSPIRERPPKEFFTLLEEMRRIGTNMNQIARQANSIGFIDTNAYWENVKALEDAISDIKEEARK